jgi:hypothetical protein
MVFAAFRILIAFAFSASLAWADPRGSAAAPRALDQAHIRAGYHDGDFDKVIKELETYQKAGRFSSPSERLFVEKYLAVVYAANPGTRELGRYHMYRLLDLSPGADLLDMFVGEEVDAVFDKVRKEHSLRSSAGKPAATKPAESRPAATSVAIRPAAWENASFTVNVASRAAVPPALAWDDVGTAAVTGAGSALAIASVRTPDRPAHNPVAPAQNPPGERQASLAAVRPAWKEPGLWIGGSAALAVVAFTLIHSGSPASPEAKTYVVPATAAR